MSRRMEGKIAVITGGTSGIGEVTAEVFVAEGATVVLAGRSKEKGETIAKRLGKNAVFRATDVMNEQEIKSLIDFTVDQFGRLDCMFNNAGGPSKGTLETVTKDDFDYSMHFLLGSVIFGMKYAAPVMKLQKSGCILNTSSIAAIRSNQGGYLYCAAKAAVTHITKIAGVELGPFGIRVNSISPGAVATPIFWAGSPKAKNMPPEEAAQKLDKLTQNLANATALKQAGLPRDVAMAALYLASDEGSYMTCQDIVVDGGRTSLFHEPPRS
ncbi:MAG: SDR family oxidoreductase [Proteobacteria bacterium]|nr:SDR family oxidoreductase [Pseudomonadota bacterium]MBU4470152.1 SDR family oxidoreductase [Pseudomonadota bacterium]MCG2753135.1 SDR family oxidoreductase [Desulfobacteraceae bacterium]